MIDLRYLLHGATIALAWFGVVNVALAGVALIAARRGGRASGSPHFWLALRLLPAAASIAFVALIFVPSYWKYEPSAVEDLDLTLAAVALAAIVLFAAAAVRGCAAWRQASRRSRAWLRIAHPLDVDTPVPAYEVQIDTPMMALVGIVRPRLLITRGVVVALTPDELRAAIAHEVGHRRAWDNLKRLAMHAAPDVLAGTRVAAALEARWASAAEYAADRAAGRDSAIRCALASALVKVAKLTPPRIPLAEPISTLVDGGEIASRVERLLDDEPPAPPFRPLRLAAAALALAAVLAAAYAPLLWSVHEATELLVNSLP